VIYEIPKSHPVPSTKSSTIPVSSIPEATTFGVLTPSQKKISKLVEEELEEEKEEG